MALLHRLRTRTRSHTLTNFSPFHHRLLSTSSSGGDDDSKPKSPFASYFGEARDNLKQRPTSPSNPPSSNSKPASIQEIMNNLSEFRSRTSVPPPGKPSSPPQISFLDLYNQNVQRKTGQSANSEPARSGSQSNFDSIRVRLRQISKDKSSPGLTPNLSRSSFNDRMSGPDPVFPQMGKNGVGTSTYIRGYMPEDLGKKLAALRPEVKGKDWFSIRELNERLKKLKEIELNAAKASGALSSTIMDALHQIETNEDQSKKAQGVQKADLMGLLNESADYLLKPPKEHLVEKYFHPDNLSSAEKMKIELTKVREEFKMSESDCGSSRVQVALLTTKIKHLSSVLHKKDVHSRKGLVAMVQKRKRLLKYLRRTDWDSYCFVISKLGLRDNPEHSNKIRTKAPDHSPKNKTKGRSKEKGKVKVKVAS